MMDVLYPCDKSKDADLDGVTRYQSDSSVFAPIVILIDDSSSVLCF